MRKCRFLIMLAVAILVATVVAPRAKAQTVTVLRTFHGSTDPLQPEGLVVDATGTVYGSANFGGAAGAGARFKLDTQGVFTLFPDATDILTGPLGASKGLLLDAAGNLAFTAPVGGQLGPGGFFKQDSKSGAITTIYSFGGLRQGPVPDGSVPLVNVVSDAAGNWYGTTFEGNATPVSGFCSIADVKGCGTVFKIDGKTGQEAVLHSFSFPDGWAPLGLAIDGRGNLYGATLQGGGPNCKDSGNAAFSVAGCGDLFRIDSTGVFQVTHFFHHRFVSPFLGGPVSPPGGEVHGDHPKFVTVDDTGTVFGVTQSGGNFGWGVIFKLDPFGNYTVLHHFAGPGDGLDAEAILLKDDKLYGANGLGGDILNCGFGTGCGTIYRVDTTTGKFTVLHTFRDIRKGAGPTALAIDAAGNLYVGTTFGGDLNSPDPNCSVIGCGNLIKLTLSRSH